MFDRFLSLFARSERVGNLDQSVHAALEALSMFQRVPLRHQAKMLRSYGIRDNGDLREKMVIDDEVAACMTPRLGALAAVPWSIAPNEGAVAREVQAFCRDFLDNMTHNAVWARFQGRTVQELKWKPRTGPGACRWVPYDLLEMPFRCFRWTKEGLRYFPANGQGGVTGMDVFADETGRFQYFPAIHRRSYDLPDGQAEFGPLFWPVYYKSHGWSMFMQALQKFGAPQMIGKTQAGLGAEGERVLREFAQRLSDLVASGVIAVDKNDDITTLQTKGAFPHPQQLRMCDAKIQRGLLGNNLSSEIKGGSFAAAKSALEVTGWLTASDIAFVTPVVQRIIDAFVFVNFGPRAQQFQVRFHLPERARLDQAEMLSKLHGAGFRPKPSLFAKLFGFLQEDFSVQEAPEGQPALFHRPAPVLLAQNREQDPLEDLLHHARPDRVQPVDPASIRLELERATDEADLERRLAGLLGYGADSRMVQNLMETFIAARGYGYAKLEHRRHQIEGQRHA